MKAVVLDSDGVPVWSDVADPVPAPNEIVIDVRAAGVNRADLLQRAGSYPPPPGWPDRLGLEVAGIVVQEATEGRSPWKNGDQVCALLGSGGQAERVAVAPELVMAIPTGYSFAQAAALPEVYATAWLNLVIEGHVRAGESVLVTGATSGVGEATIRTAKSLGTRVLAAVRRPDAVEQIRHLGADVVIDTSVVPLDTVLRAQRESDTPVNLVIDCVGGPDVGPCLGELAPDGRWIVLSGLAGAQTTVDLWSLLVGRVRLIGSSLRSRDLASKAALLADLQREIWPQLAVGEIPPPTLETFDIRETARAHAVMDAGGRVGKIVLTVPPSER